MTVGDAMFSTRMFTTIHASPYRRTNSVTHITTVLFLVLSTWLLITFSMSANTSGNVSGGLD